MTLYIYFFTNYITFVFGYKLYLPYLPFACFSFSFLFGTNSTDCLYVCVAAGILSVIMDAYLDGTIDDALLVPVTLNYERLVDGSFVREQLGMPKQMETFWSALRGIWRTLNTDHGGIRVDFNQPISLKVGEGHAYNTPTAY